MTTADWALIISLCSLLLAMAGFVWNVWSKFIYPKPKVRVSIGVHSRSMHRARAPNMSERPRPTTDRVKSP